MNERQVGSNENSNIQLKKKAKYRTPTVKMDRQTYSSRGWNTPCKA